MPLLNLQENIKSIHLHSLFHKYLLKKTWYKNYRNMEMLLIRLLWFTGDISDSFSKRKENSNIQQASL